MKENINFIHRNLSNAVLANILPCIAVHIGVQVDLWTFSTETSQKPDVWPP